MTTEMTPQAKARWDSISDKGKTLLLNNVWCISCGTARTIVRYRGRMERGDLVLEGECGTCGRDVARVVEGG